MRVRDLSDCCSVKLVALVEWESGSGCQWGVAAARIRVPPNEHGQCGSKTSGELLHHHFDRDVSLQLSVTSVLRLVYGLIWLYSYIIVYLWRIA